MQLEDVLWNSALTRQLVCSEWEQADYSPATYNTVNSLFKSTEYNVAYEKINPICNDENIGLEYFPTSYLSDFYKEHGLTPVEHGTISTLKAVTKLEMAFKTLSYFPEACNDVATLVRRVQLLHSDDDEIDISYSHPDIPFSIFVSLCSENSGVADLRLAESILHEAMHLKLTLIEKHLSLVIPGTIYTYYSPWRDEQRPVRGVLHGLFVFRAVYDFYERVEKILNEEDTQKYIRSRIKDIHREFDQLTNFSRTAGLTVDGALLASGLVKIKWR